MKKPDLSMGRLRNIALGLIVVLIAIATVVSFGESFSGLFQWAIHHQITGFWGGVWPLMVDVIILVAELGLFVAHHDRWRMRYKTWLWFIMFVALGVSVGGNTGHIQSTDWLTHLTAALAPMALAFALSVGFGVMKRTFMSKRPAASQPVPAAETVIGTMPVPRPAERAHVGTAPWVSVDPETVRTQMVQVARTQPETRVEPAPERPAFKLPESLDPTETFAGTEFKVIPGKSYTMPPDPRTGLDLKRQRVRDMYDLDPDISVNAIAQILGIAWATASKYLTETKEARGITE